MVFVYVSSPVMALIGAFEVKEVVAAPPAKIWRGWDGETGLTREEFDKYFEGITIAYGIVIARA